MIIIEIHSAPVPQKQTRFIARRGYCRGIDPSKNEKQQIQWQIRPYAPKEALEGPIQLDLTFFMPIPKGTSKIKARQMANQICHHISRPDLDNLSYLIVNAMKGIIYQDDSQIVDLLLHKRYADEPKTVIKVMPL